jgi:radical SAM protein with 4Fe4S-binding SPASM domain
MSYSNEKQPFSEERKPLIQLLPLASPLTLYIDPSSRCNLECKFCFQSDPSQRERMGQQVMDMDLFAKVVSDIKMFSQKVKKIHLHGFGEPMLNKNLASMIAALKDGCAERVAITTNATALTPKLASELIESGLDEMNVSIYAMDNASFESFTGRDIKVEKIYQNVQNLYHQSRSSNLKIHAKYVGNINTASSTRKFKELFSGIADTIWVDNGTNIWPEMDIIERVGLNGPLKHQYGLEASNAGKPICPQIFYQMLVHANGKVSPCCADFAAQKVIGDVHDQHLTDIWTGHLMSQLRVDHLSGDLTNHKVCGSCEYPTHGSSVSLDSEKAKLIRIYKG